MILNTAKWLFDLESNDKSKTINEIILCQAYLLRKRRSKMEKGHKIEGGRQPLQKLLSIYW